MLKRNNIDCYSYEILDTIRVGRIHESTKFSTWVIVIRFVKKERKNSMIQIYIVGRKKRSIALRLRIIAWKSSNRCLYWNSVSSNDLEYWIYFPVKRSKWENEVQYQYQTVFVLCCFEIGVLPTSGKLKSQARVYQCVECEEEPREPVNIAGRRYAIKI